MKCLNQGGYFKRNGYTESQRKRLFYGICVPLRLFLTVLILYLYTEVTNIQVHQTISSLLIIVSVYTIINAITCWNDQSVWWHRKFELLVSLCMIILCSFYLSDPAQYDIAQYIAIPLFIDIAYGLILSAVKYKS